MSTDDLNRAIEEADKAARSLKQELKRARALVDQTRERLERNTQRDQFPKTRRGNA